VTARVAVEAILLCSMLAAALLSAIGLIRSKDALVAIHCASLTSIAVPVLLVAAVAVAKLGSESTVKTVVICVVALVTSPICSHALARAVFLRSER
jgi:monovalent cation/proton antiporter MnhG/PhaG subunit